MVYGSSSLMDNLRGAVRSIRRGDGYGPFAIRRAADEIRREREALEGPRYPRPSRAGWYSKYRQDDGKVHVMVDRHGEPTTKYPHVHVIHDEQGGEVVVVISRGGGVHEERTVLRGSPGGNEVNAVVDRLRRRL
ncbi:MULTISPECIES: hypothetical protein [Streptomyces]|uniref:hypothetical protein n=1 Tax=Streptomyces TaxID=1883 RepID=UPI0006E27875|nr:MULTISPECIES: hypothetical protein [Streptomyces]MCL6731338.1 hypothetical protein [Streptomyces neyagawaensis]MDE1683538.1 hypothetical protein [Streptomyces neyagawaensis]